MTATNEMAVGAGSFEFLDPRPGPRRVITVYTYRPKAARADSPIVLVMHGRARNGEAYRDGWIVPAEERGFLVAVPQFSEAHYPGSHRYNYGDVIETDGTPRPKSDWLFAVTDHIFDAVRRYSGSTCKRYQLFGHSAGGQFVHRLWTLAYSECIEQAVAANSGSYTLPVHDEAYPFGLGGLGVNEDDLRALYSRRLTVLLGDADCDPHHPQLPREPGAMRQGAHRFARGQYYFELARKRAASLGVSFNWRIATAPGVAHSNADIAPFAAKALFGDPT